MGCGLKRGGGIGPKGNWIRRPRRGAAVLDHLPILTHSLTHSYLAPRVSPDPRVIACLFDHMALWTSFLEHLFLTWFSDSFFLRFGRNLAPTWPPTWTQNPPKIPPRAIQNPSKISSCFSCPLGLIFGRFLVQLGLQNHSKMHPKLSPKASQQAHNGNSKMYKKHIGFL